MEYDVAILGGGAAGLFAAGSLSQAGVKCAIIEGNNSFGKKILISGGGRCNFTNLQVSDKNFRSENPHFSKSALSRYTSQNFLLEIIEGRIPYFEKKLGQLFAEKSAKEILQALEDRCDATHLSAYKNHKIHSVEYKNAGFEIKCEDQASIKAKNIIVATGGLSIPKIGATDIGYKIAKSFGHSVTKLLPALDGFVLSEKDKATWNPLAGISLDVVMTAGGLSFRENILFTHSGLSGPASLQCSLHWNMGENISINLLPDRNIKKEIDELKNSHPGDNVLSILREAWTKRFLKTFIDEDLILKKHAQTPFASLSTTVVEQIHNSIHAWTLCPTRTMGYQKAEVTRGGVNCDEISSKNMESKLQKGLYFVGEVIDVTGWLGGYNFQWAWSSAWAASQDLIEKHARH